MALKWVVKDDDVTSVLVGASKQQQILENLKVMEGTGFSEEELRMIDEVVGVQNCARDVLFVNVCESEKVQ